jgi:hypothetical protein
LIKNKQKIYYKLRTKIKMHRTSFDANQEELMNYKLPPQALLFALLSLEFSDTNPPLSTLSLSL